MIVIGANGIYQCRKGQIKGDIIPPRGGSAQTIINLPVQCCKNCSFFKNARKGHWGTCKKNDEYSAVLKTGYCCHFRKKL